MNYEEMMEIWEERAAIREYLGGYERNEAERLAWEDVRNVKNSMEYIQDNQVEQKDVS